MGKIVSRGAFVSDILSCFYHSRSTKGQWSVVASNSSSQRQRPERTARNRTSISSTGSVTSPKNKSRRGSIGAHPYPRIMTVRCLNDGKIYAMSLPDSMDFFHQYPGVMMRFLGSVVTV